MYIQSSRGAILLPCRREAKAVFGDLTILASDLELQGGLDTTQWPLEPGQTTDIQMSTSIAMTRGYNASGNMLPDISSLRVTVSCSADSGPFYETDTLYVSPLRRF